MFEIEDFSRLTCTSIARLEEYHRMGILVPRYEFGTYLYGLEHIDKIAGKSFDEKKSEDEKLKEKLALSKYSIRIKAVPNSKMFSLRKTADNYFAQAEIWLELLEEIHRRGIYTIDENIGMTIFHDLAYKEQRVDIQVCVKIKSPTYSEGKFIYKGIDDAHEVLSLMVAGPYDKLLEGHMRIAKWLAQDGRYKISGKNRNVYHKSPLNEENPENYLTEIQIPVELRK